MGDIARAEPFVKKSNFSASWGRLRLLQRDYPSAKTSYEILLKSAEQNRKADNLFISYTGLGLSAEGMKEDEKATEYYRKAVDLTEELRSSLSADQREQFFNVRMGGFYRTAPYEGLARVQMRMNKPSEAWNTSEYTKARLFAESMSRRSGNTRDVPGDVIKKDQELTDQLSALKKQRQEDYEKNNKDQISALEPQVKRLEEQFTAHKKMLREKYPLFAATKYPGTSGSVSDIFKG